jgi:large subunit ribosomal protein L22
MTAGTQSQHAVAHLRFVRMAPRKLRRVADAIRGKSVREALVMLKFADVYAAEPIEKLVRSAVANAGNNHDMNTDDLYIARITVDGGPGGRFTKRLDPRAQGRAYFKRKRLSHVTVVVSEQPPAKPRRKRAGSSVQVAHTTRRRSSRGGPGGSADGGRGASGAAPVKKKTTARKRTAKAATAKKSEAAE